METRSKVLNRSPQPFGRSRTPTNPYPTTPAGHIASLRDRFNQKAEPAAPVSVRPINYGPPKTEAKPLAIKTQSINSVANLRKAAEQSSSVQKPMRKVEGPAPSVPTAQPVQSPLSPVPTVTTPLSPVENGSVDLQAPKAPRRRSIAYIELSPLVNSPDQQAPEYPPAPPQPTSASAASTPLSPPAASPLSNGLYASQPNLTQHTAKTPRQFSNLPDVVNNAATSMGDVRGGKPQLSRQHGIDGGKGPRVAASNPDVSRSYGQQQQQSGRSRGSQHDLQHGSYIRQQQQPGRTRGSQDLSQGYSAQQGYPSKAAAGTVKPAGRGVSQDGYGKRSDQNPGKKQLSYVHKPEHVPQRGPNQNLEYRNEPKPSLYEYTNTTCDEANAKQRRGSGSRGRRRRSGSERRRSGSQGKERRRSGSQGKECQNRRRSGSQGKEQHQQQPNNQQQQQQQQQQGAGRGREYYRRRSGSQGIDKGSGQVGNQEMRNRSNSGSQEYHGGHRRSGSQGKEVYSQTIHRRKSGSQGKEFVNSRRRSGSQGKDSRGWNGNGSGRGGGTYAAGYNKEDEIATTSDDQDYSGGSHYFYNQQYYGGSESQAPPAPPAKPAANIRQFQSVDNLGPPRPDQKQVQEKPRPVEPKQRPTNLNIPKIEVQPEHKSTDVSSRQPPVSLGNPDMTASQPVLPTSRTFDSPLQLNIPAKYDPNSGVIVHGSSTSKPVQGRRRSYSVCAMLTPESATAKIPISPQSVKSTVKIPMLRSKSPMPSPAPSPSWTNTSPFNYPTCPSPSPSLDGASGYRSDSVMSNYQQNLHSPTPSLESYRGYASDGGLLSPPPSTPQRSSTPVKVVYENRTQAGTEQQQQRDRFHQTQVQSPIRDDSIVARGPPVQQQQWQQQPQTQPQYSHYQPHAPSHQPSYPQYQQPQALPQQMQRLPAAPQHPSATGHHTVASHVPFPDQSSTYQTAQYPGYHPHQQPTIPPVQAPQDPQPIYHQPQQELAPVPRRYSEPVHTTAAAAAAAAAANGQPASTFEPRVLMSRRARRRRSRPITIFQDDPNQPVTDSTSTSTDNLAQTPTSPQLTPHQQRVQAYNQAYTPEVQSTTAGPSYPKQPVQPTTGMSTSASSQPPPSSSTQASSTSVSSAPASSTPACQNRSSSTYSPASSALPTTTPSPPTDWATMTEMELGQDPQLDSSPHSIYAMPRRAGSVESDDGKQRRRRTRSLSHYVNTNDIAKDVSDQEMEEVMQEPYSPMGTKSEDDMTPEEREAAKKAALEAARKRRRKSREINQMYPDGQKAPPKAPSKPAPQQLSHVKVAGSTTPSRTRGAPGAGGEARTRPLSAPSGHRRRRARSFNAYSTPDNVPPAEMAAKGRTRPGSAERTLSSSAERPSKSDFTSKQTNSKQSLQQTSVPQKPQSQPQDVQQPVVKRDLPKKPVASLQKNTTTNSVPVKPIPKKAPEPPPRKNIPISHNPPSGAVQIKSTPITITTKQRSSREKSAEADSDSIDCLLDKALDNLRDAKVSDKREQEYGSKNEKARGRRRLRRRDWVPDHHAPYQDNEDGDDIDEEYEKIRRRTSTSGMSSPASSSGRSTPYHDEQQLNDEYEKIKKLLGYDRGADASKGKDNGANKFRPIGAAQSCMDVSQIGVRDAGGMKTRSESSGNLRDQINEIEEDLNNGIPPPPPYPGQPPPIELFQNNGAGVVNMNLNNQRSVSLDNLSSTGSSQSVTLVPTQVIHASGQAKTNTGAKPSASTMKVVANGGSGAKLPPLEEEIEGQGRRKKGKPKAKDLNQKDKEGTDMDAFMDASPSSSSPAPADEAEASEAGAAAAPTPAAATTPKEASPAPPAPAAQPEPKPQVQVQPPTPEVSKEPSPPPAAPAVAAQQPEKPVANNKEVSPPVSQQPPAQPKAVSPSQEEEESQKLQETIRDQNEKNAAPVVENNVQERDNKVEDSKREQSQPPAPEEVVNSVENVEEPLDNKNEDDVEDESKSQTEPVISEKPKFELKYNYKEDQWSPLNPEGKMLYDRHFLLDLQYSSESTNKPTGLPHLPDIILDAPIKKSESHPANLGQMQRILDFTPGYIKSMGKPPPSGKRGSQQKHGRGSQQRDGGVKVISIERPLGGDVKLHTAENAWKPDTKKKGETDPEQAKTEALFKKVTGILNKLTPQKFQTLIQQVLSFDIDTEERLKGSIDLVFEKALDEPNFSVAYANMCKCMTVLKVPSANNPGEMVLFRNLLLNRCQKEFEKDKSDQTDLAKMREEIEQCTDEKEKKQKTEIMQMTEWKAKRRSLGNIRFIGELFKLKMLTEKIMHDCLVRLLKSEDEESYECLCRLLTTIGKDIDNPKAKQRVDTYFNQLDKIVKQKKTSARVRFMIQDVIELRRSKWVPRRDDNNPKTIEQIHKEAQHEEMQRQQLVARLQQEQKHIPQPSRGGRHGGRGSQHGQTAPVGDSDGWQTMSGKANRIDPGKMKLSRPQLDDSSIQLGPGGRPGSFGAWGRGSSGGGGKASSQEAAADRSGGPANRFNVLSGGADSYSDRSRGAAGRGMPPGRGDSREKGRPGMGNQPPRRGGPGGRSSMEHDREAALSAARNIGQPGGPRGGSGSRNQSRENSRGRDDSRDAGRRGPPPQAAAAPPSRELSEEELERKTKSLLDEYLHLHDVKEAIACVRELQSPQSMHMLVYYALNHVLEKTKQGRQMTGQLMHDLVKSGCISVDQYLKGLLEILEFAEDMVIDIPKIWLYLAEMIGPMVQDGSVPLNFLKTACQPLMANSRAGELVAEVLNDASQRLGHLKVGDQWRASGLSWQDFLAPSQDLNTFIKKHKLEFTLEGDEPRSPVGKGLSDERIQTELDALIINKQVDNSTVFDWVEANVGEANTKQPAFIRALMTSVCSSAITGTSSSAAVDSTKLTKRVDLLQRYLDHIDALELQALYALQALVHRLEHPPGVLRTFFDTLYDEDIISEDAFNQWDSSTEAAEMAGKGVARSSVEQFFTWLREAEEEAPADN